MSESKKPPLLLNPFSQEENNMTKTLAAILFLLPLTACAQDPGSSVSSSPMAKPHEAIAPPEMPGPDACDPPVSLIGKDKSVLDTMRFKNPIRVLGPDSMATM